MNAVTRLDPIRFEVIRHALVEATEEMAITLRRCVGNTPPFQDHLVLDNSEPCTVRTHRVSLVVLAGVERNPIKRRLCMSPRRFITPLRPRPYHTQQVSPYNPQNPYDWPTRPASGYTAGPLGTLALRSSDPIGDVLRNKVWNPITNRLEDK